MHFLLLLLMLAGLGDPSPASRDSVPSVRAASVAPAPASDALTQRLAAIAAGFDGDVGIAVRDLQTGRTADVNGGRFYPQQSVAKLWVGLAVLDAVDRGTMRLSDPVTLTRADLSIFHQPIRDKVLAQGSYTATVGELLREAITKSDNAANQVLVSRVGGPTAVQRAIDARRLKDIRFGPGERDLQTRIAGLAWRPEFSYGKLFWRARAFVPKEKRRKAMADYLADPMDGAAPRAIVAALARLRNGELLKPESTRLLLETMAASETGPRRLRGGLPAGWSIAHKTGTGQVLDELSTGYNDVALLTAPDGRAYAVAVMIARTTRPVPERQAMMSEVARAVAEHHAGAAVDTTRPRA